jgi:ATP-dependent exoDNAse (exonuclease V) beta subunit
VVFLCNVGAKGQGERSEVVYCKGDIVALKPPMPPELYGREQVNSSVKLRHNYFYEKMRAVEQAQATAELRRLLYVALTRAERRVYVTGGTKCDKDSFLALLLPALDAAAADPASPVTRFITRSAIPPMDALANAPGEAAATKAQVKDALSPLYAAARVIATPAVPPTHVTATSLAGGALKAFVTLTNIMVTGKSDTVTNAELGEITIDLGETCKSGYGIKHIIECRYKKDKMDEGDIAALLFLVEESAKNGVNKPEFVRGKDKFALEKNGIIAIVSRYRQGKDERFVITGYELHDKEKEATDSIRTVNAQYGYTPEYSGFRKQVGAVIASICILSHNEDKKSSVSTEMREKTTETPIHEASSLSPTDFGTAAHACVEMLLEGKTPALPGRIAAGLSPEDAAAVLTECTAMAEGFLASKLGQMAASDPKRKSEWEFRSRRMGLFINGTIDLLFVADGIAYVVDFKTDTVETPEVHEEQLRCYSDAAQYLTGLPCKAFIYYLRSGNTAQV